MSSLDEVPRTDRKRKLEDDDQQNDHPTGKATKVTRSLISPETSAHNPEDDIRYQQYCVTKESMVVVKEQLTRLTKKNKEINASIQTMRESSVDELLSIMRTRNILIDQLGRSDLPDELRELCLETLPKRRTYMYSKEQELIAVEDLLGGHEAVLEHARSACQELESKIEAFEDAIRRSGKPGFTMDDFPRMQALAKLTAQATSNMSKAPQTLLMTLPQIEARNETNIKIEDSFSLFPKLPVEVRIMIWRAGFPGPRVITHNSNHNRRLALLAACTESRQVVRAKYQRFLSPGAKYPRVGSSVVYVDPEIDTIIRDLTWASVGIPDASLFDLEGPAFSLGCFRQFTGLARAKHLALAFDVFHDNGGALFSQLQACCPDLETLTLFPSSQLEGCWQLQECSQYGHRACNCQELRFADFDSNFMDYQEFRWDRLRARFPKSKALRGLATLRSLSAPAQQYGILFPEYVEQYGRDWKPLIRIGLLMQWSAKCQAWQTRYLEGDNYLMGFQGDDGETYRGFIESGMVCGADGELLSRYDGIQELFTEDA